MDTKQLLEKTIITLEERKKDYGDAKTEFKKVAAIWSVIIGRSINSTEVALCMIALKVCREEVKHNTDNLIDICGYAALAEQITRKEEVKICAVCLHKADGSFICCGGCNKWFCLSCIDGDVHKHSQFKCPRYIWASKEEEELADMLESNKCAICQRITLPQQQANTYCKQCKRWVCVNCRISKEHTAIHKQHLQYPIS